MKLFQTIRNKLLFVFLTFGIIIILIGGISLYYLLFNYLTGQTYFQLDILTQQKKGELELFFKDRLSEIELISHSQDVKLFAKLDLERNNSFSKIRKEMEFLSSSNYYSNFFISDGVILKRVNLLGERNGIQTERLFGSIYETSWIRTSIWRKTVITDYNDVSDNKSIIIASPIIEKSRVIGFIGVEISSHRIEQILYGNKNLSAFSKTGDIFIVGRDYQIRSKNRFFINSNSNKKFIPQIIRKVFEDESVNFEITNEKGVEIYATGERVQIPFLNWALFATIEKNEALAFVKDIEKNFLLILTIFTLGIIVLAYFLANKITNPIEKLRTAVKELGKGEFAVSVSEKGNDEIAELSRAFNEMAINLKEKTAALKDREMRLFHLYSATNDGIILYENDKPVLVNRAIEKLTGFTREEISEKNVSSILNREKLKYNNSDGTITFETSLLRKENILFPAEVQIRKIQYFGKEIDACVIRDISKRREVEKELEKTKEQLLSSIFDETEKERQRLARELHDGLGQMLIALQLQLQQATNENREKREAIIENVINNLDGAIEEIRNISNDLIPAVLNEFGLSNALEKMCNDLNLTSKSRINYTGQILKNPPNLKTISYLYRIAQEAISNAIKYSNATEINVILEEINDKIILTVKDNGIGFNPEKIVNGFGLNNMKERTKILNGKIDIIAEENKGVEIRIEI